MQSNNYLKSKWLYKGMFDFCCKYKNIQDSPMMLWCSSSVYVEGDIETRVYNDSINGEVKSIPEICIRRDGMKFFMHSFCWSLSSFLRNLYL